jgi:aminoacyl tRNA synthase complex-interacting multifunctional protein 1
VKVKVEPAAPAKQEQPKKEAKSTVEGGEKKAKEPK